MRALLLAAFVLLTPLALASETFHHEGELTARREPGATPVDEWRLELTAGQLLQIDVQLDDPDAWVSVSMVPPSMRCQNQGCATLVPAALDCERYVAEGAPLGGRGAATVLYRVPETGAYVLGIGAQLADDLGYTLDLNLAPEHVRYLRPNGTLPGTNWGCILLNGAG